MMLQPEIARQLAAERQRDLLDHASRHRQARAARAARPTRHATAAQTRPRLLGRVHALLTSH